MVLRSLAPLHLTLPLAPALTPLLPLPPLPCINHRIIRETIVQSRWVDSGMDMLQICFTLEESNIRSLLLLPLLVEDASTLFPLVKEKWTSASVPLSIVIILTRAGAQLRGVHACAEMQQ